MLDTEAVAPPIDLSTAQAADIADYLRPRLKDADAAKYFECPFDGRVWLETLHFLPQAFIQSARGAGQPSKDDKFTHHFNTKLGDLFPMTPAATELPTGRRMKKRTDLYTTGNMSLYQRVYCFLSPSLLSFCPFVFISFF